MSNGAGARTIGKVATGVRWLFRRANYRVRRAQWLRPTVRCGEAVAIEVVISGHPPITPARIDVCFVSDDGSETKFDEIPAAVIGGRLYTIWNARGAADDKLDGNIRFKVHTDLVAEAAASSNLLQLRRMPDLASAHFDESRSHFDVATNDRTVKISSNIKYLKGWGASVVNLGASAPQGNAGAVAAFNVQGGPYWWMKQVRGRNKYWNGNAWVNLPRRFVLHDGNNFCVGFYKQGNNYTCQYGGTWPERFADWNIDSPPNRRRITQWRDNIITTWNNKFDIKRRGCQSGADWCCRYQTEFDVSFEKKNALSAGTLIVAPGNIRSNDSLWFLAEPRLAVAAHEFGHHLGNPDEYAGAAIDASLNGDGAVNGIDADSIMGQNLTHVKWRHFRTICRHLAQMVKDQTGLDYRYRARSRRQPPGGGA